MRNYSKKTVISRTRNLSALHSISCKNETCISQKCQRSSRIKLILPKNNVESLDCDKCTVFQKYETNAQKQITPDFLIYSTIPGKGPKFTVIEFKEQANSHAIKQIANGFQIIRTESAYFNVIPKPEKAEGVIARDRRNRTHAADTLVIMNYPISYLGQPVKRRLADFGDRLFNDLPESFYR